GAVAWASILLTAGDEFFAGSGGVWIFGGSAGVSPAPGFGGRGGASARREEVVVFTPEVLSVSKVVSSSESSPSFAETSSDVFKKYFSPPRSIEEAGLDPGADTTPFGALQTN